MTGFENYKDEHNAFLTTGSANWGTPVNAAAAAASGPIVPPVMQMNNGRAPAHDDDDDADANANAAATDADANANAATDAATPKGRDLIKVRRQKMGLGWGIQKAPSKNLHKIQELPVPDKGGSRKRGLKKSSKKSRKSSKKSRKSRKSSKKSKSRRRK